mgnify:CR=1 FL=1
MAAANLNLAYESKYLQAFFNVGIDRGRIFIVRFRVIMLNSTGRLEHALGRLFHTPQLAPQEKSFISNGLDLNEAPSF